MSVTVFLDSAPRPHWLAGPNPPAKPAPVAPAAFANDPGRSHGAAAEAFVRRQLEQQARAYETEIGLLESSVNAWRSIAGVLAALAVLLCAAVVAVSVLA